MAANDDRALKLRKFFYDIINGKVPIGRRGNQFIEAICAQGDAPTYISKLVASPPGLTALQHSMWADHSPAFYNGHAATLFQHLSEANLETIGNGSILKKTLLSILEPPIFWTPFTSALVEGRLDEKGKFGFAWLLYHAILLFSPDESQPFREVANQSPTIDPLLNSNQLEVRNLAHKIKHRIAVFAPTQEVEDAGPGGRHDNDFVDFREISIIPTADEVQSSQAAFIRPSNMFNSDESDATRQATYLDNQFRLLREDMIYDVREEIQAEKKRKKHRNVVLGGLKLVNIHYQSSDTKRRGIRWSIILQYPPGFPALRDMKKPEARKNWLQDNRQLLKHQSMACLLVGQELVALTSINRDEDHLALLPPQIVLHVEGSASVVRALLKLKTAEAVKLIQIDTAMFAYQPILKAIQDTRVIPLSTELLFWETGKNPEISTSIPQGVIDSLKVNPTQDLQSALQTSKSIILDKSQSASFIMGLTQALSLIQGPPGTGKSFIGALLAKAHHDFARQKILVVCYTNHALDQFLEDLLDIGIPQSSMVRLGGKSTDRTKDLSLHIVQRSSPNSKLTRSDWADIGRLEHLVRQLDESLETRAKKYESSNPSHGDIMEHLEFDAADGHFYDAFTLPTSNGGDIIVNKKGRALEPLYLLKNWLNGYDAGALRDHSVAREAADIWNMPIAARRAKSASWKEAILREEVNSIAELIKKYDGAQAQLDAKFDETVGRVLAGKRIIGCTTTAAAKYRAQIHTAAPDVLLVEEAGEILESHILTALSESVAKVILIGDHKQLRPKVSNYQLTVEKGEGYDLNRSLFERLVLKGYPHQTLLQQHRMRPEISALVRHLTYPDLVDAPKTQGRADIRGLRDNVVFIHHTAPENDLVELNHLENKGDDVGAKSSKKNKHEVDMVLKILRYLGQQGYRTDQIVILTPYLGQLRALQQALKVDNDPVLNDLDSADLVRAGLVTPAAAKLAKKPIRLATIDNYQGEESDIVIASLTRSNNDRKIGFMAAPERINVLLSRARDGLIMIGNAQTFMEAKSGDNVWSRLFEKLGADGHVYDGLPAKCERHSGRVADLACPDDFDQKSPDGGCTQPCGATLACGVHPCASKCHQIFDHSKMKCDHIMYSSCPKGHQKPWQCHAGPPDGCARCAADVKIAERKQKEAYIAQEKREREQRQHDQRMAELDAKIEQQRIELRDSQLAEEREKAYKTRLKDLRSKNSNKPAAETVEPASASPVTTPPDVTGFQSPTASSSQHSTAQDNSGASSSDASAPSNSSAGATSTPTPPQTRQESEAEKEWKRQKQVEGAQNPAIDEIMEMGGLEKVKLEILAIKAKVEVAERQGTDLKRERFSVSMLGNPGTGKTTVARRYGQFLATMNVVDGTLFKETTGSSLANDGVNGAKKLIEEMVNAGGGTFFIDEAYQLTSAHNFEGGKVLDYLLAEIENQIGKIVFIFAGYSREMEKFFEHNPGLKSRVPYTFNFEDYEDEVLMDILEGQINKKFSKRMQVDGSDGIRGLHGRIAIRRLGQGRGRPGFGNARSLENLLAQILSRQAKRITAARKKGLPADDLLLIQEDLIGPDPSTVMAESAAWKKLQSLIGLESVKQSVTNFFTMVKTNYQRELLEKKPQAVSLNRVFYGNPGTGKTTVAKLYGRILADLGLLSNGEVVVKNPADFVGAALGESEKQTKAILANTEGKVLVIDEAYMLYGGRGATDTYKTAVIDTIVAEVQSVPGEDRCVLLLGYKEQMEEMFQNVNPGLSRRFAIENAFHFEDYDDDELRLALEWKLKDQDLTATEEAKRVAIEVLSRARNRPNFGNIGEVENILSKAKMHLQSRHAAPDAPLEPEDFDPDYRRSENAALNLSKLFEGIVGSEDVIKKLAGYQQMAAACKARGMDAREMVPTNFIFKGPPGTGKTTTARKMGQVFYDMGFLSSTEVVECSTSDLVGEYVGQTGPKTKKLLDKALGRILFIDEAYRLGEGHFAKEAVDELVSNLTLERYRGKIIVILAGYDKEMNDMLAVNPGLSSRFTEEVVFTNLPVAQSFELLHIELAKKKVRSHTLTDASSADYQQAATIIRELSSLPSWGNGRDLKEMAKQMIAYAFTSLTPDSQGYSNLSGPDTLMVIRSILTQKKGRSTSISPASFPIPPPPLPTQTLDPRLPPPPPIIQTATKVKEAPPPPPKQEESSPNTGDQQRDPGVSDAVWNQLQADRQVEELAREKAAEDQRRIEEELLKARLMEEEASRAVALAIAAERTARDDAEKNELMRRREQARLRELAMREQKAKIEKIREAKRLEEEKKRKEEVRVQAKIREMGLCVAGFRWIKQADGYRCAGGVHFLSNGVLGIN